MSSGVIKAAKKELLAFKAEKKQLQMMKMELEAINSELYSPSGAALCTVPTHGGGNRQEERLVKLIDDPRRNQLIKSIANIERRHKLIEAALSELSLISQKSIKEYYDNDSLTLIRLGHEAGYSLRTLERIRHNALKEYASLRGIDGEKMTESWRE